MFGKKWVRLASNQFLLEERLENIRKKEAKRKKRRMFFNRFYDFKWRKRFAVGILGATLIAAYTVLCPASRTLYNSITSAFKERKSEYQSYVIGQNDDLLKDILDSELNQDNIMLLENLIESDYSALLNTGFDHETPIVNNKYAIGIIVYIAPKGQIKEYFKYIYVDKEIANFYERKTIEFLVLCNNGYVDIDGLNKADYKKLSGIIIGASTEERFLLAAKLLEKDVNEVKENIKEHSSSSRYIIGFDDNSRVAHVNQTSSLSDLVGTWAHELAHIELDRRGRRILAKYNHINHNSSEFISIEEMAVSVLQDYLRDYFFDRHIIRDSKVFREYFAKKKKKEQYTSRISTLINTVEAAFDADNNDIAYAAMGAFEKKASLAEGTVNEAYIISDREYGADEKYTVLLMDILRRKGVEYYLNLVSRLKDSNDIKLWHERIFRHDGKIIEFNWLDTYF